MESAGWGYWTPREPFAAASNHRCGSRRLATRPMRSPLLPAQVPVGGAPVAFALRNKGGNPDVAFQTGMMLVQFVSSTRVRAEVFPNATPADPIAFGANAQDFVR